MTEKKAKEKLMDYLYNEMDNSEIKKFEEVLFKSPELQHDLREIQSTINLLQAEPGEIPHKNLLLIQPDSENNEKKHAAKTIGKLFYLKASAMIAAAILLTVVAFSFVNLQISNSEQGLLISFGDQPTSTALQPNSQISEEDLYSFLSDLREENTRVYLNVLEQTRQEHMQQLEDVIQTLTTYYDQRRQQDLLLISAGLAQLEEETYYRFLQTEEALEDLIFALNYQQPED